LAHLHPCRSRKGSGTIDKSKDGNGGIQPRATGQLSVFHCGLFGKSTVTLFTMSTPAAQIRESSPGSGPEVPTILQSASIR
jgi:hypothetical protein